MSRLLAFLTKRPGMSRDEFIDYYENRHVPLIRSIAPGIVSYRRNYLEKPAMRLGPLAIEPSFDVVTEFTFGDEASCRAAMAALAEEGARIRTDESQFLDVERITLFRVESME